MYLEVNGGGIRESAPSSQKEKKTPIEVKTLEINNPGMQFNDS